MKSAIIRLSTCFANISYHVATQKKNIVVCLWSLKTLFQVIVAIQHRPRSGEIINIHYETNKF